jgi:glutamate-1-semialdehyde 2,1-aminomutase
MVQAVVAPAKTTIRDEFVERFAASRAMNERARRAIPSGITHDGRFMKPFPLSVVRADGARKWTVDGQELIDFSMGHGSLILGHNDPDVLAAMQATLPDGTHFGAGHEREVAWAEQISRLVPSAELVKFTNSGTESTLLAIRIARVATGKTTIVKFEGHFHGWNDYLLKGERPPFQAGSMPGIPEEVLATVEVLPADLAAVEARLGQGDVAGVILEPSGGSWAMVPLPEGFLGGVRTLTSQHEIPLIFDEVITGFRWAPGGAQARYGVDPDLTTMAKIVAGGMPGGAVVGTERFMRHLEFRDEPGWNATKKVRHQGTYNSNPLAAAAGLACLQKCADPAVQSRCDALASGLRAGLNGVLVRRGLPGFVWGESSVFHVGLGERCANLTAGDLRAPAGFSADRLKASAQGPLAGPLQQGMLLEGIDLFASGGLLSVAHTEGDVETTVAAFDRVLGRMESEGFFE